MTSTLVATPGTAMVYVVTGGGTSNSLPFTINPPAISSLTPSSATARTSIGFTLTVNESDFLMTGAPVVLPTVYFGSTALTTTFVNSTRLTAPVPTGLLTTAGTVNVTVVNPGGATSAAFPFTILPRSLSE